jgi:zeaxanthin glucosyltransferase
MINEPGHLLPTYSLANKFKKNGLYNIIYIANREMEPEIVKHGFGFEEDFDLFKVYDVSFKRPSFFIRRVITNIKHRLTDVKIKNKEIVEFCHALVLKYRPCLVFVDDMFLHYRIALHNCNVPIVPVSIVLPSYKDKNIPLPNSIVIPDNTLKVKMLIQWEWMLSSIRRKLKEIYYLIKYNGFNYRPKSLARYVNYPFKKRITYKQFYGIGEKKLDKIIVCPDYFDFPREKRTNICYIESCVDLKRTNNLFNWNEIHNNNPLVYCALGTQAHKHYKKCDEFFQRVIRIFQQMEDYNLVIAVGKTVAISSFGSLPNNVYAYESVPQIEVLRKTIFMITHGGLGTIKECILSAVPMLVYPVNLQCDQNGNAARVVYHKIGLKGCLRKDSQSEIEKNIHKMLETNYFKRNIIEFQIKFSEYDKKEVFENFIKTKFDLPL